MRSSQRIRQVLSRYQRKPNPQQGILGNEIGEISVPNRVDFVYVRVAGLGTISVYNKRVPLILDLPVDVGYDPLEPKNFQVLNIHRYPQGGGRGLVDVATILHGKTHNWAGIDPVYIEKRQLMPLRPTPLGGMQLYVTREVTYYDDKAVVVTGQQLDLAPYVPATGSLMVLLYKDTDEIIKIRTGGVLKDIFTLALSDAPQAYPGTVPIALIRLYGGQTGIAEGYNDTDLTDVRQLFSPIFTSGTYSGVLTGTSSGGHIIQDEGSNLPARGHLNFSGAGVIAQDDAGNDATKILITGGGVARNGSTTDHHLAVWNGSDADSIEDGGAIPGGIGNNGWISADAMTYASADDPTYTLTVSGDKSTTYQAGQRIKLTQSTGGTKYFIVTKVEVSGDTTLTLYGGTDYNLENEAVSNPYYSPVKAPFGFPLDPTKWMVRVTPSNAFQTIPTQNTWYNVGSASISIPIGAWEVLYQGNAGMDRAPAGTISVASTLSTANNSESDSNFTCFTYIVGTNDYADVAVHRRKLLNLNSKTTYYLNLRTLTSIGLGNLYASSMIIEARCAYL